MDKKDREWDVYVIHGQLFPGQVHNPPSGKIVVVEKPPDSVLITRDNLEAAIDRHTKETGGYYSFSQLSVHELLEELFGPEKPIK
jgi:hypothetical protein